jgi:hypothetical protein
MQHPLDPSLRNDSTIHVYFDMSNYQITLSILNILQAAFEGKNNSPQYQITMLIGIV